MSFSEPISVVKVISNMANASVPSSSGDSVSNVNSDSQKESLRIPSVLKVENPFTDKQGSALNTDFSTPQFSLQNNNPRESPKSMFTSQFLNKTSPVSVPTTESTNSKIETVTGSPVTVNTTNSNIDSTPISKPGGFSFDLKVDKKVTEEPTGLSSSEHRTTSNWYPTFGSTEDKNVVSKQLPFVNKDAKSNIENTLGVSPKPDNIKNISFGVTETKKDECSEEKKKENVSATVASNYSSAFPSLASTSPPKFAFSSLSSPVINNALNFKSPTSISQTSTSDVLKQNLLITKDGTQLQNNTSTSENVQKSNHSVLATVVNNSSTDAVTSKENKTEGISVSDTLKTQSSQSNINQNLLFNSPVTSTSHSTEQFKYTFGSNNKTVFSTVMDKKHSTDKEGFSNIFMNSPNKNSTQGFGNIFNKESTDASNTLTKSIFGAITKEGQNKTGGVVNAFANSNDSVKSKTEIYTDGFVNNNVLQQKVESTGSFGSDKPVTNGFTFTSASGTTVANSGIFSNVFNTSQLQTTTVTTSSFTSPKFTSTFGNFPVQSTTTSHSSNTPTFSFGSTNNTHSTGSVFGNIPTNAFTASNSGSTSNFSGLNQSNFNATENKAGFGITTPFTFGSGNMPTNNFMFGSKQPTTTSETAVFGSSSFKPTDSKVFTFGGSSVNQTGGPASGVFAFGQTAGPATAQPVFQFNTGSNISSQPSAGKIF